MDLSTKTFGKLREHGRTVRRVLAELFERYFTDHVARSSAELAYYMLFMLFPLLIFGNMAISAFHLSSLEIIDNLSRILPEQIVSLINEYIAYIASLQPGALLYAGSVLTVHFTTRAAKGGSASFSPWSSRWWCCFRSICCWRWCLSAKIC